MTKRGSKKRKGSRRSKRMYGGVTYTRKKQEDGTYEYTIQRDGTEVVPVDESSLSENAKTEFGQENAADTIEIDEDSETKKKRVPTEVMSNDLKQAQTKVLERKNTEEEEEEAKKAAVETGETAATGTGTGTGEATAAAAAAAAAAAKAAAPAAGTGAPAVDNTKVEVTDLRVFLNTENSTVTVMSVEDASKNNMDDAIVIKKSFADIQKKTIKDLTNFAGGRRSSKTKRFSIKKSRRKGSRRNKQRRSRSNQ